MRWIIVGVVIALVGCATTKTPQQTVAEENRQRHAEAHKGFVAVQAKQDSIKQEKAKQDSIRRAEEEDSPLIQWGKMRRQRAALQEYAKGPFYEYYVCEETEEVHKVSEEEFGKRGKLVPDDWRV